MTSITLPNGRTFPVISSTTGVVRGNDRSHPAPASAPKKRKAAHRIIERPLDGDPVDRGTLELTMVPPSVNSLFFNRKKGRGKTLSYRNWCAFADRELRDHPSWHVPGKITIRILIGTTRGDCDNRIKAMLDALVAAGRINDDRNVVKVSAEYDDAVAGTRIEIERAG